MDGKKEVKRMKKLYFVTQAVWGRDRSTRLYFETRKEAEEYSSRHSHIGNIGYETVSNEEAKELLELTCFELCE